MLVISNVDHVLPTVLHALIAQFAQLVIAHISCAILLTIYATSLAHSDTLVTLLIRNVNYAQRTVKLAQVVQFAHYAILVSFYFQQILSVILHVLTVFTKNLKQAYVNLVEIIVNSVKIGKIV
jgi:hypothetical protein